MNITNHHRQTIRLKQYDYSQPGAYFITVCVKNKECLLGEIIDGNVILNSFGEIVVEEWVQIPLFYKNVIMDQFIVMPNHFHGIVCVDGCVGAIHELPLQKRRNMLIPRLVGRFKMRSSKRINQSNSWPGVSVWQRNYYERVIRNEDELRRVREYIVNNPINQGEL